MTYFKNVSGIGDLRLDKILFEFDNIPMIFVCKDQKGSYYFCLCTDVILGYTCMITKASAETLLKLLADEITILDMFRMSQDLIVIADGQGQDMTYTEKRFDEIPKDDLPEENEKLENPSAAVYAEELKKELRRSKENEEARCIELEINMEIITKMNQERFTQRMMKYVRCFLAYNARKEKEGASASMEKSNRFRLSRDKQTLCIKMTSEDVQYLDYKKYDVVKDRSQHTARQREDILVY